MYKAPIFCTQCAAPLENLPQGTTGKMVPACPRCGEIHWLDPKVAAGCLIVRDGRVLLLQRSIEPGYGLWVFPGGHVDRGETVEDAALRETREECGAEACIDGFLGLFSYPGRPIIVAVYRAHLTETSPEPWPRDETMNTGWFTAAEAASLALAFPSTADALSLLFSQEFHAAKETRHASHGCHHTCAPDPTAAPKPGAED